MTSGCVLSWALSGRTSRWVRGFKVGSLIIRIGFWGMLYYSNTEPPKTYSNYQVRPLHYRFRGKSAEFVIIVWSLYSYAIIL